MAGNESPTPSSPPRGFLLRRGDQVGVAAIGAALLATSFGWYWAKGGPERLIELERAEPRAIPFLVDINRAEVPELVQLPGIGPGLAERIVASRKEEGPFRDVDDLDRVRGIGPKTLDRLRPFLLPIPADEAMAEAEPTAAPGEEHGPFE